MFHRVMESLTGKENTVFVGNALFSHCIESISDDTGRIDEVNDYVNCINNAVEEREESENNQQ